MTQPSTLFELPASGFLADVSSEHRAFLAGFGKFLRPRSGEILISEGDSQESLYMILSGTLHVVANSDDRPILLAAFGEGDSLGEINLFDPATACATAIMRSEGQVWVISREELDAFLDADPAAGNAVMRGLLQLVAKRIRMMNQKLATAEQRGAFHDFWNSDKR